jgi:manganese transport protein
MFTSDKLKMGEFVNSGTMKVAGWVLAGVIAILNAYLLWQTVSGSASP